MGQTSLKILNILISLLLLCNIEASESLDIADIYKEYFSNKEKNQSIDSLDEYSIKIRKYGSDFHQNLIEDLNDERPLFGLQLTNLHKLLSVYLDIQKKLLVMSDVQAGLMAYHNYHDIYFPYYQHHELRRYLNDEDLSYGIKRQNLYESLMTLLSWDQREKMRRSLDGQDSYNDHPIYSFFIKEELIEELVLLYGQLYRKDLRNDNMVDFTNDLSRWFGNTVGAVRWRKGYLYKDKSLNREIEAILKPLDIITEKTYFALTDKLIPGHFGHNALWLGTREQLVDLGLWSHPSIVPYQREIEKGKSILEVDRTGTHLKSLADFMNVDEFAIMRLTERAWGNSDLELIYRVALSQMGKIYDFNFDVETTDRLVCSELMYQSFGSFNWPTEELLNRVTISPDNVASLALYSGSPIRLLYYIAEKKKGKRVYKDEVDLAHDIDLKYRDGKFYYESKDCRQTSRGRRCQTTLKELIYEEHNLPNDFPI